VKALLIDGTDEKELLSRSLSSDIAHRVRDEGFEITHVVIDEKKISPCRGCFNCWISTPGECVINDYGRELNRLFVINDLILFIGPVFHGCHSAPIKKVFDRSIPFLQPFFRKVGGEVHHRMRYAKTPDMIFIGIVEEKDDVQEATFRELSSRNAINFGVDNHQALFHCHGGDPSVLIDETIALIRGLSR